MAPTSSAARLVALPNIPGGPRESVPSALDDPRARGLPEPLVDPARIRPGGPPPDGIAPVDHPLFERAAQVDWLSPQELVLAVDINGDARAYPVQVMIWHEIANDTVGGVPVAVTYCPLCNTAIAFDRRAAGRVLDFGTSGKLYNSDLVGYDRQTRSLWVQILGRAVAGVLTGTTLRSYPVQTVSWAQWRAANPIGWVLGRVDASKYAYGDNPYPGYDDVHVKPFLYDGRIDVRLPAQGRVLGIQVGGDALAISLDALRRHSVLDVMVGGHSLVVWWQRGAHSPLRADTVSGGDDIGATGVFSPSARSANVALHRRRGWVPRPGDRKPLDATRPRRRWPVGRTRAHSSYPRRHVLVRVGSLPPAHQAGDLMRMRGTCPSTLTCGRAWSGLADR